MPLQVQILTSNPVIPKIIFNNDKQLRT